MSCALEVAVDDGQTIVVALASAGAPVTLYEDQGCQFPATHTNVSAYEGTATSRTFYVAAAGSYTLTVTQDGAVIHAGSVTVTAPGPTLVGPFTGSPFAGDPAPQIIDGGSP